MNKQRFIGLPKDVAKNLDRQRRILNKALGTDDVRYSYGSVIRKALKRAKMWKDVE